MRAQRAASQKLKKGGFARRRQKKKRVMRGEDQFSAKKKIHMYPLMIYNVGGNFSTQVINYNVGG